MRQKSTKLCVFSKRNCARLSAGRLPHQIVSDFDDLFAVWKLSVSAFQKPKFYQNPMRLDGLNCLQKVGRNFVLRKCTFLGFFVPSLPKEKYLGKIPDIYLYFFFVDHPNIYLNFFFALRKTQYLFIYIFSFFSGKILKKLLSGSV